MPEETFNRFGEMFFDEINPEDNPFPKELVITNSSSETDFDEVTLNVSDGNISSEEKPNSNSNFAIESSLSDSLLSDEKANGGSKKTESPQVIFLESETAPELPSDLSNSLANWLQQCTDMTEFTLSESQELGEQISKPLRQINQRRMLPGFRLAFVGEFSRGKSSLINRLLERNILPEGALPTTATITSIVADSEEKMTVKTAERIDVRLLEESSWENLLATDRAGSDREILARVQICLNNEWLRSLNAEIIDTPGAGDLNEQRANMVSSLLNECDAAVLLISATSPFSMTESFFLDQEVIGRHVPRIIVAISKFDLIPATEREKVMEVLNQRIALTANNIPILPTYPVNELHSESEVLAAIKLQIESLVSHGDRRIWRSRQMSEQLSDWLNQIITISQGVITNTKINAEEKKQFLRRAENERERADIAWGKLRADMDERRLKRAEAICQRIKDYQKELLENLGFDMQEATDVKKWWERDLPFRLRRELRIVSRKYESLLLNFLTQDTEWIKESAKIIFPMNVKLDNIASKIDEVILFCIDESSLTNLQMYRTLTRIGSTVAMIAGSVLGGPIGTSVSAGILLASEQYLDQKTDKQRAILYEELTLVVDRSLDIYCQQVSERLQQLYGRVLDGIDKDQKAWKSSEKAAFTLDVSHSNNEKSWYELIDKASLIRQEIILSLSI
jgi:small GTP-binding protein